MLSVLFFFKWPPFAKWRVGKGSNKADETEEYTGKPELEASTSPWSHAAEIAGRVIEHYQSGKDAACELGESANTVHEMLGDGPEVRELPAGDHSLESARAVGV